MFSLNIQDTAFDHLFNQEIFESIAKQHFQKSLGVLD
jgi:hypothetical protein